VSHPDKNFPPIAYVLIAVFIWSTGGMFIKMTTLDAYQVTFFRSSLAAITVFLLTKKNGLRINAFGILASVIYAILLFLFVWATKHGTAANAIFLQYTAPIYILVLAPFLIGEKFHVKDLVTVVFCIGGMSLFFVGQLDVSAYQANIAALCSGVFLGLYIMLLRHPRVLGTSEPAATAAGQFSDPEIDPILPPSAADSEKSHPKFRTPHSFNPVVTVIYGNAFLALATAAFGLPAIPTMTPTDWLAVSFLGIVQIGIAYILFIKGVTEGTRPLDASIIGFIEPLLNPVWVYLSIGERPTNWALIGGAIIIATVAAHTLTQYRRPVTAAI